MSREIKFRAWDLDKKEWIELDSMSIEPTTGRLAVNDAMLYHGNYFLMQYTGLKDKKGVEIYEGDIIQNVQAAVNEVIWYEGEWCYSNYHAGALPLYDGTEKAVIGNIYENKDLLENK